MRRHALLARARCGADRQHLRQLRRREAARGRAVLHDEAVVGGVDDDLALRAGEGGDIGGVSLAIEPVCS